MKKYKICNQFRETIFNHSNHRLYLQLFPNRRFQIPQHAAVLRLFLLFNSFLHFATQQPTIMPPRIKHQKKKIIYKNEIHSNYN